MGLNFRDELVELLEQIQKYKDRGEKLPESLSGQLEKIRRECEEMDLDELFRHNTARRTEAAQDAEPKGEEPVRSGIRRETEESGAAAPRGVVYTPGEQARPSEPHRETVTVRPVAKPAPQTAAGHVPDPEPWDGTERTLEAFWRASSMHKGFMNRLDVCGALCRACTTDKLSVESAVILSPGQITVRDGRVTLAEQITYNRNNADGQYCWVHPHLIKESHGTIRRRETEQYAVFAVASLLFATLFCTHPFIGKQFYVNAGDAPHELYTTWRRVEPSEDFIFADGAFDPDRGMINGVHEVAFRLWRSIGDRRRAFFLDALMGRIETRDELCARWQDAFTFRRVYAWAPCNKRFPCMLFDDGEWLVVTRDLLEKSFYCRRLEGRSMEELCADCGLPEPSKQVTRFATLKVALVKGGEKVRDVFLAPAAKYRLRELIGEGDDTLTVVASAKRNDLLVMTTERTEIKAVLGDSERVFAAGENVPLLPDVLLRLGTTDYALCAPAEGWHV